MKTGNGKSNSLIDQLSAMSCQLSAKAKATTGIFRFAQNDEQATAKAKATSTANATTEVLRFAQNDGKNQQRQEQEQEQQQLQLQLLRFFASL